MTRTNDRVAEALGELADLLAISGADPFRVRAYEKAARAVAAYPIDVDGLDEEALDAIPTVGSHISAKIVQLLTSGRIGELDDLRAQVPAGLRSLLSVPGLGPRRARQIYDELHVASIPELLDALGHEELRELRGWGPTSEHNLARAIEEYQAAGGRMQLGTALDLAEELVGALRTLPGVGQAAWAGSLRRMCETIGDIDLLVASDQPGAVMDGFGRLPQVAAVPARGDTKAVAVTTAGVHVDLRVVAPEVWGAALLYFTGSKAHNIHLRRLAQRAGCKLSEYGLAPVGGAGGGTAGDGPVRGGKAPDRVVADTEAHIYEALGMDFVPPTLREDGGEIEAALDHALPVLVDLGDIHGDLHTHTSLTDGMASLEEMVTAARRHGYRYLGVTDHAPLLHMQRMTDEKALAQRAALRQLEPAAGMALLHGSELNIQPDGSLDWDDDFLAGFDLLVASIHSAFDLDRDQMTARLVRAVEHPAVNVIGHPTARSIGHRPAVAFDADAVFRAAARAGTALEINAFPDRLDLDGDMARLAQDLGVRFAISSDAHAVRHLDNLRYGVATAQRGWVRPENVINTWPLDRLRHFLAKGRRRQGDRWRGR